MYLPKGNNIAGASFGNLYFLREEFAADVGLHVHELVHSIQSSYLGMDNFLKRYVAELIHFGYRNNPFEKPAYNIQYTVGLDLQPFDVAKVVREELDLLR